MEDSSDADFGAQFQMVIDNSIMHYLDSAEEHGIKMSIFEDDEVYVNLKATVDIVMRAHGLAAGLGVEAETGSAIMYDVVLSLAQILTARNYDVTPNDIMGFDNE